MLDAAATLDPLSLRSLDAIHLTAALVLENELDEVITYDQRMADAAAILGLAVTNPG